MQTCSYCGKSNAEESVFCQECGVELIAKSEAPQKINFVFFRWKIAAAFLWIETVLFTFVSISSFWIAREIARKPAVPSNPQLTVALNIKTAIGNTFIALFCFAAWYLMRRKTKLTLMLGASLVCLGFLATFKRWVYWEMRGTTDPFWIEPLFVWFPLIYSIIYAYRTSKMIVAESPQ
jgi:hypothetical protein